MRSLLLIPLALALGAVLGSAACSARHLPPGTPPPEYEPPVVAPWLADGVDAGKQAAPAPNDAAASELAPAIVRPATGLSPDAGVR